MSKRILFLMIALSAQAQSVAPADTTLTPLEIVDLRMRFYNERQIDAMLELYGDDIEVYAYPDRLLGKGKLHLRGVLEEVFRDSTSVTISQQLVRGRYVVSEERVSYGGKARQTISIYEVRDGLIRTVRFIRD